MLMLNESHAGNISVEEFAQVMSQSPGKPPSKEEVEQIIKEVDLDGDGTINFNGEPSMPAIERKTRGV
jgi:Ca2+-binding EF-hand superfamily protein